MTFCNKQINGGDEYLPYADKILGNLTRRRLVTDKSTLAWGPTQVDNAIIYVVSSDAGDLIRIEGLQVGFICHPRDTIRQGGTTPAGANIPGIHTYPLVDDDHGSRVLSVEAAAWEVTTDVENYGNLDWAGPNNNVLTFRGPFSRVFPLDSLLSLSGYTEFDYMEMVDGLEISHYTPFRGLIYQSGELLKEFAGGKVCGCAVHKGALIAIVSFDYAGITNPDGETGGFYDEVWRGDVRIGYRRGERPSLPWYFNSLGDQAVNGGTMLVVTEEEDSSYSARFDIIGSGYGNLFTTISGSDWNISKSGEWPIGRDFNGNQPVYATLKIVASESSSHSIDALQQQYEDLPVKWSGEPELIGVYPYVGAVYQARNMCPGVTFSGDCLTFDGARVVAMNGCCPPVTVSAEDNYGHSVQVAYNKTLAQLQIIGAADATVNGQYYCASITDSDPPVGGVSWSFDKGTIDTTGKITSINGCSPGERGGTITATDECGRTATKQVRLPDGVWITTWGPFSDDNLGFENCEYGSEIEIYFDACNRGQGRASCCQGPPEDGNHEFGDILAGWGAVFGYNDCQEWHAQYLSPPGHRAGTGVKTQQYVCP
jgi:hypothetical protein